MRNCDVKIVEKISLFRYTRIMNDFTQLLLNRRSKRRYLDKAVPPEIEEELMTTALASPSGKNRRPWECILIRDRASLEALSEAKAHGASFLAGAPLAIAVAGLPEVSDTWIEDCSIVSINIQLAAQALGLGSCWIQIYKRRNRNGDDASRIAAALLGLPESAEVLSVIALGYSDEERPALTRETLSWEKAHREQSGNPW